MKKSYVFAGASQRGWTMFMQPMKEEYPDYCELRGVYDTNIGRANTIAEKVGIKVFDNFENMINETKPDFVVVTTVDAYHHEYIIKSLEMGCDVITEKPMTTDTEKCNAIIDAEKRTGRKVIVTFNYRYAPFMTEIKKILMQNIIGDIFSVHFEWMLDASNELSVHGTSYFRRWNSRMEKSGGLLVHKSTHHFDLVNWWINQRPVSVSAFAKLNKYGKPGREKYAEGIQGENCRVCEHKNKCEYYFKIGELESELYVENEKYDGYFKDGCIYSSEIDIYDTMAVNVTYSEGALLSYSLNATAAYEGWRISINGSKGRLEAFYPETGINVETVCDKIKVFDLHNKEIEYKIPKGQGGHGGGDNMLHQMLFIGGQPDPLGHTAGTKDGAASIIVGIAGNKSIKDQRIVSISELVEL